MGELVSIVVPVYNMSGSIGSCVESLLAQDYKEIEILLIDDGSTDDSYQECMNLADRDARVTTFHTENRGAGPARNLGIERAKGRYVCFPDADDRMPVNAVSAMAAAMNEGQNDFVIAGFQALSGDGKLVREKIYPDEIHSGQEVRKNYDCYVGQNSLCGINGAPWNKLYDLQLIRQNHIEFPPLRRHQDTAFVSRYLCYAVNVHFIPDIVYIHYLNDLRKEWYKYPADYIDSAIGLYAVQKETVLLWNPENQKVKDKFLYGYIANVIKAMELTYSPRVHYSEKERIARVKEMLEKSGLGRTSAPPGMDRYRRTVFQLLQQGRYHRAVLLMRLKVFLEKNGILDRLKK